MSQFGKRDMRSNLPMAAISDLRQARWSGTLPLVREGALFSRRWMTRTRRLSCWRGRVSMRTAWT